MESHASSFCFCSETQKTYQFMLTIEKGSQQAQFQCSIVKSEHKFSAMMQYVTELKSVARFLLAADI